MCVTLVVAAGNLGPDGKVMAAVVLADDDWPENVARCPSARMPSPWTSGSKFRFRRIGTVLLGG